jgi:hypothetical protein
MAIQKTILKNDSQRAVVYIVGTAGAGESSTVLLTDLINTSNGETSSGALKVNISYIWSNSFGDYSTSVHVSRGTSTIVQFSGTAEYPGQQQLPSLDISNQDNIVVTFNGKGQIALDLRKISGYVQPNRNVGV